MEQATPTAAPVETFELALQVRRAPDGRLEGTLHRSDGVDGAEAIAFSGTLDLLKALESALGA